MLKKPHSHTTTQSEKFHRHKFHRQRTNAVCDTHYMNSLFPHRLQTFYVLRKIILKIKPMHTLYASRISHCNFKLLDSDIEEQLYKFY